jgi:pimeloyl-ACP methyl ester carboxylesterase
VKRRGFIGLIAAAPLVPITAHAAGTTRLPGFADALDLVRVMQARDDDRILPAARTNCYHHGRATDLAVVLFHGFTNNPAQFARLAAALYVRGCNILVPRLPGHGDADRMTTRLESVTAEQFMAAANDAVDAARGLGSRLAVSGISLGAALCAWLATRRSDIDRSVCVATALSIDHLPYGLSTLMTRALLAMPPTKYAWWDSRLKEQVPPRHAYPRYPIRVLGECYRIGEAVIDAPGPFPARDRTHVLFVINPNDPAVNNDVAARLSQRWRDSGFVSTSVVSIGGLPKLHDIVEPDNPAQRVAEVYPELVDLIAARVRP